MEFGEKLRIVRTDRGLTQEQLAETLSVSRQSRFQSGFPVLKRLEWLHFGYTFLFDIK